MSNQHKHRHHHRSQSSQSRSHHHSTPLRHELSVHHPTMHRSATSALFRPSGDGDASMVVDYYYGMHHRDMTIGENDDGESESEHKRCFVLSPIGPEGSEIRQHADDVLSFIIMPATHSRNIECVRSDMKSDVGGITDVVYDAVFNWDLCIAVLTSLNPNVFYELALRQCVGLPVICLIQKGDRVPFDVADQRLIEYTLNPTPLFQGKYAQQVANAIDSLAEQEWKTDYAFAKFQPRICSAPMYFGKMHDLRQRGGVTLGETIQHSTHVDIMGTTLRRWKKYEDDLKVAAAKQCDVRILMMDKDNPALSNLVSLKGKQLEALRLTLDDVSTFYAALARSSKYITLRKVKNGAMLFSYCRTDKEMIYQPHFYDQGNEDTPVWHCESSSTLYHSAKGDFELLWERNREDEITCCNDDDHDDDEAQVS
ncbi:uncharacterized protein [Oscarella lobularis]|uniref:uncharacterized protein n=1 Tax=Oscarella lobularis TaxID=121494 RepID=UPI0033135072